MRKFMMTVAVVTGLALTAGCKRSDVQDERQDLAAAQQEAQEQMADIRQETAQERAEIEREAQEERAEVREELAEERQELADARQERAEERAEATTSTIEGRMRSSAGDTLVLIVPANNQEMQLKTDEQTRVTQDNREVELEDFPEGTQVRASYVMQEGDLVARDVVILVPMQQ